ncbi:hypothetical protein RCJ22_23500 [Vibrio sp. FNV 38]|nr:hypothetical protein [Vibrio sp. FNV 38]
MKKTSLVLLSTLVMLGCTSQPRLVDASLPLVNHNQAPVGKAVETQYWSQLDNDMYTMLAHESFDIQLEPTYTSALGLQCRVLNIWPADSNWTIKVPVQRIACKQIQLQDGTVTSGWYLINDIVESSTVVEI